LDMLYLNYWLRARHRNGRGIHPPFAYGIVSEVIYGSEPENSVWAQIEEYRHEMLKITGKIPVEDHGAGSRRGGDRERRICDLVRHSAVSPRRGRLLARLAAHLKPATMIELGTGSGIGSLYLAKGNPGGRLYTCEGSPAIAQLAEKGFNKLSVGNIEVHRGMFAELLPGLLDQAGPGLFVFIDGDHREERLVSYVSRVLASKRQDLSIVLDDIHWSMGMYRAWRKITRHPEISLSIELFNMGIVFVGEKIQKDHFVVNF
jgi:predicted O-methyltransferase YrrM